ncbi:MAG: ATP-dependent helicase [Chloroflexota bacterium]
MNRSLLDDLNPQQRAAVETVEGPLLILAGAGSGKTRVLTHRVANLILNHRVPAGNILAVTFTNKAASEMKQRVEELIGGLPFSMSIGTFHSICVRLLRREIGAIGWDTHFTIADDSQQQTLVKTICREMGVDEKRLTPSTILGRISSAKNELVEPDGLADAAVTPVDATVAAVYTQYQSRLKLNNALDFDDLLTFAVRLFQRSPETLEHYRLRWRYVLVDEYQDTNHVQYIFTKLLAAEHHNICVVGDDDQSIYSWRGANIRNILEFEKDYPETRVIKLEQNYRSTQTILDAAHAVVSVNIGRKDKQLWTQNGTGSPVAVQFMPTDLEEARFVVREIRRLVARGDARAKDCAVLYRTNAQSRLVERAFTEEAMPYQVVGGPKFYDRREIRDLLAYLRLISNPSDDTSLLRIVNVPPRGLGEKSVEEVRRQAAATGVPMWQALGKLEDLAGLQARAIVALRSFRGLIDELMDASQSLPLLALLELVLERTGFRQYINPDDSLEGQDRWENISSLLTQAQNAPAMDPREGLAQFLDEVALVSDQDTLQDKVEGATLITLHAAKGLEFPVVFITGMSENIFPHRRVLDDATQMEEERRLAYVGMTRAKRRLYLVHAEQRSQYGSQTEDMAPSRFLLSIPQNLLQSPYGANRGAAGPGRWGQGSFARPERSPSVWTKPPAGSSRWKQGELVRPGGHGTTGARHHWEVGGSSSPPPPASTEPLYHAGLKVRHATFGQGIVIRSDVINGDENVSVAFEGVGVKKLSVAYAPLEKVG